MLPDAGQQLRFIQPGIAEGKLTIAAAQRNARAILSSKKQSSRRIDFHLLVVSGGFQLAAALL